MFSILVLGALVLISLYYLFVFKSRIRKCLGKFPSPPHHRILGIVPSFLRTPKKDLLPMLCKWSNDYGDFRLWSPFGSSVILTQSASIESLLTSHTNLKKGFDYDYVKPWLGDGLLISTGQKWFQRRKMLTPAFHFKILEDFMTVFNQEARKMVSILRNECSNGETFDIHDYVTRCALDIICETAMGKTINAQDDRNSEYIQAINEFSRIVQYRSIRPWLRYDWIWRVSPMYRTSQKALKVLHGFTERVIKERKKEILRETSEEKSKAKLTKSDKDEDNIYFRSKKRRLAFLDLLLEVQSEHKDGELKILSDQDIREETDTFMFEGHDTTAANTGFTIFALGNYPEIQKKVQEELDMIFNEGENDREITTDDLSKMKYLECVIKESLRLYPSVPLIQRKLISDLALDGKIVPSEVTINLFLFQLHRDPKKFPEPLVFRPERFCSTLDEDTQGNRDPFAFVPFSAGPRNCIGQKFAMMEEKVMIATVLRNFNIKSMLPPKDLPLLAEIILKSEVGLPIRLTCR